MTSAGHRPICIANASGFYGDRMSAMQEVVSGGPIDVVTGDYLAEVTMSILGKQRARDPQRGFVPTFLAQLKPVLGVVLERGIKVVVNAGGLNPHGLGQGVRMLGAALGLAPKVATLSGDDLQPQLEALRATNADFLHLESGAQLPPAAGFVYTANAYLGAWGIVRALQAGADIVICPRVTDASLVVGAAAWWHGWQRDDYDALAGAVAAGHVIECGPQATGGNYSAFRTVADLSRPGFPLAEIAADGSSVICMHPGQPGAVTVGTVTAQLVYEVGAPRYLNPDVVTRLDTLGLKQLAENRVGISGAQGEPPPDTTKVAVTCKGSYRNEMTFAFVGLDVDAKIALFEGTTRTSLAGEPVTLTFQRVGAAVDDAARQEECTVLLRVVASSDDEALVSRAFSASLIEQGLSSYPGLFGVGLPGGATEATGYWPTLVRQADLRPLVSHHDGREEAVASPPQMQSGRALARAALAAQTGLEPLPAAAPKVGGAATQRGPLGLLVDARSGDKGSDANVGLWTRSQAAYDWLRGELSVARFKQLLPEAAGLGVERYELPKLFAVNFVVRDLLAGGAVATLRFDRQAKALGEFLRSRWVELPSELLPRG